MLGIQVVSRAGATLDEPVSAVFGDAGGAIGRGADCTLILADPERRISRRQLVVVARDGRHFIRQISASVVVELNGVPLVPNIDYALDSGTQVRIGPYLLRTVATDAEPAAPATPVAAVAPAAPSAPLAPVAPSAPVAPLAPLASLATAARAPAPAPVATQVTRAVTPSPLAEGQAMKPATPMATAAPVARATPAPAPTTRPAQRPSPPGLPASLRGTPRPSLDELMEGFGLGTRGARSSVFGSVLDEMPAPAGVRSNRGPEPGVALPTLVPGPSNVDLLVGDPTDAGLRPSAAAAAAAGTPLAAPHSPPAAQGVPPHDALAALYEGLGVPAPGSTEGTAAQLKLIGGLLRGAVEGTLALLAARMIAKRELGANATLLQTRENNPLKFSPDADVALGHLLGPAQRGFIAPLAAVNDAFNDLRAHEVAVLAGMRAALDEVLARFDPQALEQRFAPKAMWDSLLPMNRKASLWEAYAAHHAEILREIEGDFDSLFGRAFLQAYQAQLAQLALPPPA